jgi:topoisomerase-4 subunit A
MSEHKQSDSTLDLFAQVEDNPPAIRQAHGDPLLQRGLENLPIAENQPPEPPAETPNLSNDEGDDSIDLPLYAERCYLEYAMSVVKGRALPDVQDGQKPVQRRILYTMKRLGLDGSAKPVKSARVVGEVLGKYHPHGDSAAYEAMVRMAQGFTLRYPLVDGQGNFGSRDGDGAAAMRYTEARLTPISDLLLSDLDSEVVDWTANYDGSLKEPLLLPARLPFALLNGASGIAVGMACELPSHNLTEVAAACKLAVLGTPTLDEVLSVIIGPDFTGGGQLINPDVLPAVYAGGRGSIRLRARWQIEPLAKGQWRVVIYELPQGVSTAKIMAEIETLLNPQPKAGKKAISQEQAGLKTALSALLDFMRDESDGQHPIRLVLEPRARSVTSDELMTFLLAHTSLEVNIPVNLTLIGSDGNPRQKGLLAILNEWAHFRVTFFNRRCIFEHRKASERAHILEGRLLVLVHIDEVIAVIRHSDDPKLELMARFSLSETQAEDILEIRLRQLARLEHIKIQQELNKLNKQIASLARLLASDKLLRKAVVAEIDADSQRFGDTRRTLIESAEVVTRSNVQNIADEPIIVIVSKQGFVRTRTGKVEDPSSLPFKTGDCLLALFDTRTVAWLFILDTTGRAYSIPVAQLPSGKGDGVPIASLIDLAAGARPAAFACGNLQHRFLVAGSHGKGFICTGSDLFSNRKAGKTCLNLDNDDKPRLHLIPDCPNNQPAHIALLSNNHCGLVYPVDDIRVLSSGAGVILIAGGLSELQFICQLNEKITLGKTRIQADKLLGTRATAGTQLGRKRSST